jgi:cytochrome c peroxidase
MADEKSVVAVLETIPEYTPLFQAAFPGEEKPVTYDNMAKAIGAFERGLVTPSPFDRLLAGDQTALTDAQKAGLTTFVQSGCTTCHTGPLLGGGMYQKLGLVTPWPNPSDAGRFDVTKNEADKQLFKVPSLRNIEETGPYFHDGSVATLDEAIRLMGHHQLGRELSPEQVGSIQTFLGSLTGELPTAYIAEPPALASGPKTPKPDPS